MVPFSVGRATGTVLSIATSRSVPSRVSKITFGQTSVTVGTHWPPVCQFTGKAPVAGSTPHAWATVACTGRLYGFLVLLNAPEVYGMVAGLSRMRSRRMTANGWGSAQVRGVPTVEGPVSRDVPGVQFGPFW